MTQKVAGDVEFVLRETATSIFLIAVKRAGQTIQVQFRFLGTKLRPMGYVLFEQPRQVTVTQTGGASAFTDWFAPTTCTSTRSALPEALASSAADEDMARYFAASDAFDRAPGTLMG